MSLVSLPNLDACGGSSPTSTTLRIRKTGVSLAHGHVRDHVRASRSTTCSTSGLPEKGVSAASDSTLRGSVGIYKVESHEDSVASHFLS